MSKHTRTGGKYSGSHTTVIPAAATICDIAEKCPSVKNIVLGFIKSGLRCARGNKRVKIDDKDGAVLLSVRDNISHQEIFVYANDLQEVKLVVAKGARDAGLHICFGKKSTL